MSEFDLVRERQLREDKVFVDLMLFEIPSWIDLPVYMSFNVWWRTYDPPNIVDSILECLKEEINGRRMETVE